MVHLAQDGAEALAQLCFLRQRGALPVAESATERVSELRGAFTRSDAREVHMQAHALKGTAANISAEQIRAVAGKIEDLVCHGGLDGVEELLPTLERALDRFREASCAYRP